MSLGLILKDPSSPRLICMHAAFPMSENQSGLSSILIRTEQPRSQGVFTSYANQEAEWTSIKCAQKIGALAAIMDFTVC